MRAQLLLKQRRLRTPGMWLQAARQRWGREQPCNGTCMDGSSEAQIKRTRFVRCFDCSLKLRQCLRLVEALQTGSKAGWRDSHAATCSCSGARTAAVSAHCCGPRPTCVRHSCVPDQLTRCSGLGGTAPAALRVSSACRTMPPSYVCHSALCMSLPHHSHSRRPRTPSCGTRRLSEPSRPCGTPTRVAGLPDDRNVVAVAHQRQHGARHHIVVALPGRQLLGSQLCLLRRAVATLGRCVRLLRRPGRPLGCCCCASPLSGAGGICCRVALEGVWSDNATSGGGGGSSGGGASVGSAPGSANPMASGAGYSPVPFLAASLTAQAARCARAAAALRMPSTLGPGR